MEKKKTGGCGAVIAVVIIIVIIYSIFSSDDKSSASSSNETPSKIEAYITAKDYVKSELKAPATADFGDGYTCVVNQDSTYDLAGTVDSQNSFGANLRANWRVSIKWNGGDWKDSRNWTLLDIYVK